MRKALKRIGAAGISAGLLVAPAWAAERPAEQFPKDVQELASAWTEPFRSVAEEARRRDPISGLGVGLLKGTFRSLQRTVNVFAPGEAERERPGARQESEKLLEYSF